MAGESGGKGFVMNCWWDSPGFPWAGHSGTLITGNTTYVKLYEIVIRYEIVGDFAWVLHFLHHNDLRF